MAGVKITDIWLDGGCCDKNGRNMALTVDLSNRSYFMICLDSIANRPLFNEVVRGGCGAPETDGERVYWPNGASLSIPDMVTILQSDNKKEFSA